MISEDLLQSFIAEASDLLDDVEPSLVEYPRLESEGDRTEIVNRVFRHFHSIKGSAGFVGLHGIARLTHEAETLLEQFRKAPEKSIPRDSITLLCRTVDLLRAIFERGGEGGGENEHNPGIDALIAEILSATRAAKSAAHPPLAIAPRGGAQDTAADATQVVPPDTLGTLAAALAPGDGEEDGSAARPAERPDAPESVVGAVARRRKSSDTARVIHTAGVARTDKAFNATEFAGKFVSEANDLLEQIEQALLQVEQQPEENGEALQESLRLLHSFKGNSGFMNLADLERLSHRMESEVEKNIGRPLGIDTQVFDVLLQMIDVLRQGVLDYSCGGSGAIPEADGYIAMMDEFTSKPKQTGETARIARERSARKTTAKSASLPGVAVHAAAAAEPAPPRAEEDPRAPKKDTDTRQLSQPPAPKPRKSADTTRLVLRDRAGTQENLSARPKADTINIDTAAPDTRRMSREAGGSRSGSGRIVRDRDTDPALKKALPTPDTAQKRRAADQFASRNDIRVDLRKLDSMLDLVGELVIAEAMVTRHPVVWDADNESLERAVHQLRRVAASLQDMATSVRMIPLAPTFRRMTRLVYDLSVKAGKQVDLVLLGEETEVDRTVIERISDPLVHIIRNAIDHGIEPPAERAAAGKPETGRLTIEGHHEGGEVWIVITDDGRGLDREAIYRRALSRGLIQGEESELTDNQIFHFIFEPGFSTASKVTDISGRGFGMDVVKKNIEKLSGKIDIRTRRGEGTAVVLRIPLTLAIIDGMLVRSDETRYIIPLLSIRESLRPDGGQILSTPDGQEMVKLREELIPVVRLDEAFGRARHEKALVDGILMIVEGEDGDVVALFADELLGQQETVIKGLSGWLKKSRGVSGCTILGDGEVGLILDIGAIVRLARQKYTA